MSNSPDSIYLDLSVTNNDNLGNKIQNSINFTESRTNAILDNPSNYDMSIIRFNVDTPGPSLPIITPLVNVDGINSDPNELAYTITMAKVNTLQLDNLTTQHVRYSPEDQSVSLPNNQYKTTITGGTVYPTVNNSFSTEGNNSFSTSTFSGSYPVATTPTQYVGKAVESNAHGFSVVWDVGEFTIGKRPQGDYSYLEINNLNESTFGYNFTNWTLGRSANLSEYFNESENIFEIYWLSSTSVAIKVYADFPYVPTLQPGESATFTRANGDTTVYNIIFTAPLDTVPVFPSNTVTTVYPVGASPTVTFSNAGNIYVPPIQTSTSIPPISEYLGYFVSLSATGFSPPNYNSLNPLQLSTNSPIPTTLNQYAGATLSVEYANFILYQSTRYTLLTSTTILVNDIDFTQEDSEINYNYVLGGRIEAIPNICSQTEVSAINFQSNQGFNQEMTLTSTLLNDFKMVQAYTPVLTEQEIIDANGAVVTYDSAVYNLGLPTNNQEMQFLSFPDPVSNSLCYLANSVFNVSSLPANYENYLGATLQFDYLTGSGYVNYTTPPIIIIEVNNVDNLIFYFDPFAWPMGNVENIIQNLRLNIANSALINSAYGLTTISSINDTSLNLSSPNDPTTQFPFLYQNTFTPPSTLFVNPFWEASAQVVAPSSIRMIITLADASTEPLNIPSAPIAGHQIILTNISAYEPFIITGSSYSAGTGITTFTPANNWALPDIPTTTSLNSLHIQYLILTTITFPSSNYNQWTANLLSISMEGSSISSVIVSQNISNGYYNIYNVKWFLCLVNKCLRDVWLAIEPTQSALAPFFTVDEGTNFFTLFTPCITTPTLINFAPSETAANGLSVTTPIYIGENSNPAVTHTIFFNEPLYNLFCGINSVYYGNKVPIFASPNDQLIANANPYLFNYYMQPINYSGVNKTGNFTFTTAEYSSVPMWSPIKSIQFTSTLLPNLLTYTSTPVPFNNLNHNGQQNIGNNSEISSQITDIQIGLVTGSEYKPQLLYVPRTQYRLITLLGSNTMNAIDFQISFTNKYGEIIPMRLSSQCTANLKILFQRKRMNLKNLPPYDTN